MAQLIKKEAKTETKQGSRKLHVAESEAQGDPIMSFSSIKSPIEEAVKINLKMTHPIL